MVRPTEMDTDNLPEDILKGIEEAALANQTDVVFIDNITALGQSLDKGSDAGSLMAALNALKKQHNWTLIILNHVPKMFSGAVPLSLSAIQGQSHKDPSMVYVKQCKWRNGEIALDSGNVALYERGKDASGNLCFTFKDYGCESDHLSTENTDERDSLKLRVRELSAQGKSQQEIAAECAIIHFIHFIQLCISE